VNPMQAKMHAALAALGPRRNADQDRIFAALDLRFRQEDELGQDEDFHNLLTERARSERVRRAQEDAAWDEHGRRMAIEQAAA
jgi:hypothetical protein